VGVIDLLKNDNALWVFPIPGKLQQEVREIAVQLHSGEVSEQRLRVLRKELVHALNGIIDSGFVFYYEKPSEKDDSLSPMVKRTIDSIIGTVRGAIHLVVQRVFKAMPAADLKVMAYYLDSMVVTRSLSDKRIACLAFPLGDEVRGQLAHVMSCVEKSEDISHYSVELTRAFIEIVRESVHYYYHLPTGYIKINRFAKKAADIGIDTTVKGIQRIIKRVIKDVSHKDVVLLFENLHNLVFTADTSYQICSPEFVSDKQHI